MRPRVKFALVVVGLAFAGGAADSLYRHRAGQAVLEAIVGGGFVLAIWLIDLVMRSTED